MLARILAARAGHAGAPPLRSLDRVIRATPRFASSSPAQAPPRPGRPYGPGAAPRATVNAHTPNGRPQSPPRSPAGRAVDIRPTAARKTSYADIESEMDTILRDVVRKALPLDALERVVALWGAFQKGFSKPSAGILSCAVVTYTLLGYHNYAISTFRDAPPDTAWSRNALHAVLKSATETRNPDVYVEAMRLDLVRNAWRNRRADGSGAPRDQLEGLLLVSLLARHPAKALSAVELLRAAPGAMHTRLLRQITSTALAERQTARAVAAFRELTLLMLARTVAASSEVTPQSPPDLVQQLCDEWWGAGGDSDGDAPLLLRTSSRRSRAKDMRGWVAGVGLTREPHPLATHLETAQAAVLLDACVKEGDADAAFHVLVSCTALRAPLSDGSLEPALFLAARVGHVPLAEMSLAGLLREAACAQAPPSRIHMEAMFVAQARDGRAGRDGRGAGPHWQTRCFPSRRFPPRRFPPTGAGTGRRRGPPHGRALLQERHAAGARRAEPLCAPRPGPLRMVRVVV